MRSGNLKDSRRSCSTRAKGAEFETTETVLKYLLDTNAVSALMKGEPAVIQNLQAVNRSDVAIPQPVIAEITYGIERIPASKRREMLQKRFDALRMELGRANWTDIVSERFGAIKAVLEKRGKRIEDFDAAIAAHALAEDAILVTANLDQMTRVPGLKVKDWSKT